MTLESVWHDFGRSSARLEQSKPVQNQLLYHNINQRNRKQKQSTKDVLERRANNPYLAACKIRIWEEMSGTPIAPRGANKRNREFTGAISRILQRADKDIQEEESAPRGARKKDKKSRTRRVSGKKHTQQRSQKPNPRGPIPPANTLTAAWRNAAGRGARGDTGITVCAS